MRALTGAVAAGPRTPWKHQRTRPPLLKMVKKSSMAAAPGPAGRTRRSAPRFRRKPRPPALLAGRRQAGAGPRPGPGGGASGRGGVMLRWGRALRARGAGGFGGGTPRGTPEPGGVPVWGPAGVSSRRLRTAAPLSSDFFGGEIARAPRHRTGDLGHTTGGGRMEGGRGVDGGEWGGRQVNWGVPGNRGVAGVYEDIRRCRDCWEWGEM